MSASTRVLVVLTIFELLSGTHAGSSTLRGVANQSKVTAGVDIVTGGLSGTFKLLKQYDLGLKPEVDFDVEEHPDANLTHSCANYTRDGSTVFTRDGKLVLKVASKGAGGRTLNSGRVMSKAGFKYGLFSFTAKVPKCHYVWPAIWLLPVNMHGEGNYGGWPCSGEIDILETVHDQAFGTYNLVSGYGSGGEGGCLPEAELACNKCRPGYCTSTTMNWRTGVDRYFVENTSCDEAHPSWEEHRFVLNWQPEELTMWIDPVMQHDAAGRVVGITPKMLHGDHGGVPSWKTYQRHSTPEWKAVEGFMQQCFPESATPSAPFDDRFKIVLNIAVGGYGGSPCMWGTEECGTKCGGAVGAEMVMSDITVWERTA